MVRHGVHLGSSVHVCNKKNIQLTAKGSAQISSHGYLDAWRSTVLGNQLDSAWVVPGNILEMKLLIIRIPAIESTGEVAAFLGKLGDVLSTPEFWSGLGLAIERKSYETTIDESGFAQFQVILRVQRKPVEDAIPGKKLRFPYSLKIPDTDLQPPSGILSCSLHEVELYFDFSVASLRPISKSDHSLFAGKFSEDIGYYGRRYTDEIPVLLQPANLLYPPALSSPHYSDSQSTTLSDEFWDSLDSDSPFSSQQLTCSYLPLSPIQTRCTTENSLRKPAYGTYISLLEAGLRSLISNYALTPPPDTTTLQGTSLKGLAEFCPTVFCPGYNLDISQRACLIPMIMKGMVSMLGNTSSPTLLQNTDRLKVVYAERYTQSRQETDTDEADLKSIIKCFLWSNMQQGLINSSAIRRLASSSKAMRLVINPRNSEEIPFDDLLDDATGLGNLCQDDHSLLSDAEWHLEEDEGDWLLTDEENDGGWDNFASKQGNKSYVPKSHHNFSTSSSEQHKSGNDGDIDIILPLSSPLLGAVQQSAPESRSQEETGMVPHIGVVDFSSSPRPLEDDDWEDVAFSVPSSQALSRGEHSGTYALRQYFDSRCEETATEMLIC